MIDWNDYDRLDPADWVRLADLLLQKAIAAIHAAEEPLLKTVHADLVDFMAKATAHCPRATMVSINATDRQVTKAILALKIKDLAARSATLDAAGAKVSGMARSVREDTLELQLAQVRGVLGELAGLSQEVHQLRDDLSGLAKRDVPARIDAIQTILRGIQGRAQDFTTWPASVIDGPQMAAGPVLFCKECKGRGGGCTVCGN